MDRLRRTLTNGARLEPACWVELEVSPVHPFTCTSHTVGSSIKTTFVVLVCVCVCVCVLMLCFLVWLCVGVVWLCVCVCVCVCVYICVHACICVCMQRSLRKSI